MHACIFFYFYLKNIFFVSSEQLRNFLKSALSSLSSIILSINMSTIFYLSINSFKYYKKDKESNDKAKDLQLTKILFNSIKSLFVKFNEFSILINALLDYFQDCIFSLS